MCQHTISNTSYPVATTTTQTTVYESIPDQPVASTSADASREPPVHVHPLINRPTRSLNTPTRNNQTHGSATRGRSLQQRFTEGSCHQRHMSNKEEFVFDSDAEHNNT